MVGLFFMGAFGVATAYAVNVAMYITFRCLVAIPIMVVYDGCATFCKYTLYRTHNSVMFKYLFLHNQSLVGVVDESPTMVATVQCFFYETQEHLCFCYH